MPVCGVKLVLALVSELNAESKVPVAPEVDEMPADERATTFDLSILDPALQLFRLERIACDQVSLIVLFVGQDCIRVLKAALLRPEIQHKHPLMVLTVEVEPL